MKAIGLITNMKCQFSQEFCWVMKMIKIKIIIILIFLERFFDFDFVCNECVIKDCVV